MELEIIGFTIEGCRQAEDAGANRIELCDNPHEGGTTPSYGMIKLARKILNIQLFPIIRPRGGDFLYNSDEFEIMLQDVLKAKELGCDGVVIGILNPDGTVDKVRTKKLVQAAYPMDVTFHRAFDRTRDIIQALEDVIDCGCTRILTSGGFPNVDYGIDALAALNKKAGGRIGIMPGSGVRKSNLKKLIEKVGAINYHSSARQLKLSEMEFSPETMNEKLEHYEVDVEEVKALRQILDDKNQLRELKG